MAATLVTFKAYDTGQEPEARFHSEEDPAEQTVILDPEEEEALSQLMLRIMFRLASTA